MKKHKHKWVLAQITQQITPTTFYPGEQMPTITNRVVALLYCGCGVYKKQELRRIEK